MRVCVRCFDNFCTPTPLISIGYNAFYFNTLQAKEEKANGCTNGFDHRVSSGKVATYELSHQTTIGSDIPSSRYPSLPVSQHTTLEFH
jgi:hypothetical protein